MPYTEEIRVNGRSRRGRVRVCLSVSAENGDDGPEVAALLDTLHRLVAAVYGPGKRTQRHKKELENA